MLLLLARFGNRTQNLFLTRETLFLDPFTRISFADSEKDTIKPTGHFCTIKYLYNLQDKTAEFLLHRRTFELECVAEDIEDVRTFQLISR